MKIRPNDLALFGEVVLPLALAEAVALPRLAVTSETEGGPREDDDATDDELPTAGAEEDLASLTFHAS